MHLSTVHPLMKRCTGVHLFFPFHAMTFSGRYWVLLLKINSALTWGNGTVVVSPKERYDYYRSLKVTGI
jgi:hypothetical protein